jgi:hypothetical protein
MLPSNASADWPNAILPMAAAMYGPTPGSARSASASAGSRLVQAGRGKRSYVWESFQESYVVGDGGVDLGLDQHDLGHPDAVRVSGVPPRQVAPLGIVPSEQPVANLIGSRPLQSHLFILIFIVIASLCR